MSLALEAQEPFLSPTSHKDMPNPDGVPSIEVFNEHGKENFLHFTKQRLSRSPHPYHRNRESLDRSVQEDTLGIAETNLKPGGSIDDNRNLSIGINTLNGAWRANRSIDDSGTDADDESGPILQSLPAPPLKWRKGLRQQDGQVTPSPLLTPSCLDDDDRRLALERQILSLTGKQSPTSTDNETRKIREKFSKRRRAELLRRITECLLLSFVGYISIIRRIQSSSAIWQPGTFRSPRWAVLKKLIEACRDLDLHPGPPWNVLPLPHSAFLQASHDS